MPALAFCGHTDVVPPGDLARWPAAGPFELRLEDGTAYGRGACDMKGGLVAVLGAVAPSPHRGCAPPARSPFTRSAVRRTAGGGFATLRRGHRASACVIAEPTSGAVVLANAGSLTFRLEIEGRATHGSTREAASARWTCCAPSRRPGGSRGGAERRRAAALLAPDLAWPLSIGVVRADWASTVPERLVAGEVRRAAR